MRPVRMANLVKFGLGIVTALRSGTRLRFWLQLGLGIETLLDIEAPDAGGRTRRILPIPYIYNHTHQLTF